MGVSFVRLLVLCMCALRGVPEPVGKRHCYMSWFVHGQLAWNPASEGVVKPQQSLCELVVLRENNRLLREINYTT